MRSLAVLLLALGIGSYILPHLNLQFRIMSVFGRSAPTVAAVMAVAGAVLLVISIRKRKDEEDRSDGQG